MFRSTRKVDTALMRPIVPMEMRSSMPIPVFSNRRARYTTNRRLRSMSVCLARSLPAASSFKSVCSCAGASGWGKTSLPPMYKIFSGCKTPSICNSLRNSNFMLLLLSKLHSRRHSIPVWAKTRRAPARFFRFSPSAHSAQQAKVPATRPPRDREPAAPAGQGTRA